VKLISWNVNGLRSVLGKGFSDYINDEKPDVLCVQESRCLPADVANALPAAYTAYFHPAEKPGYAGTAIFCKKPPLAVAPYVDVMGKDPDKEGRVLTAEFADFFLVNVYTPNAKRDLSRLGYRQEWDKGFLRYLKGLEKKKPVVFCGDLNVAHTEIDLANPKANVHNHGFTPEERAGFSAFVKANLVDTFRELEKAGGHYTWWSPMGSARARNIGWRLDYFLVSAALRSRLKKAFIRPAVRGSDHCPVGIEIK
jgi:exodeoxyribonuclease-3